MQSLLASFKIMPKTKETNQSESKDSNLEEIGWDSLAVITAIAIFDEVYGVTLNVEKLKNCKILKDIIKLSEK